MADLDHNLSLADALTEPPPEIEEEVKRDFIATLEAEKFDDVVGETVDKTDYVPLLDDDDAKPGSQEPKSKAHADGIQVEHTSASGPTVVENGDHGMEDHRTVFPGEIMDEKLSYKEFLDRNDSWTMDDRDLCFESQPVFKPMEMADPFSMHRGDNLPDLSFPTDMKNVPLFVDHADASRDIHAPHGPMMVPEQPFLGPLYSPAEALDPSAFIGLDSTAEFLEDRAVPEEHWMGAQHDMKGPDASFFVEPPVPPTATEAIKTNFPESPVAAAPGFVPAAVTASPGAAEAADGPKAAASDAACVPALDVAPVSAEKAGSVLAGDAKPAQALDTLFAPAAETSPFQAMDVGFAPPPEAKAPPPEAKTPQAVNAASTLSADTGFPVAADATSLYATDFQFPPAADAGSHYAMDFAFAPAADTKSPHAVDSEFAPAADTKSHHALDSEFAPAADTKSHHALDSEFSPAADAEFAAAGEVNHHHVMDSAFSPVADAKPLPAVDSASAKAEPVSAADTEVAATQELKAPEPALEQKAPLNEVPAEATANVEHEPKVPEICVDVSEKAKDSKTPPSPHDEHLPEHTNHLSEPAAPVEAKEAVALEDKDLLPEKSVTAGAVSVTEKEKEEAEHNHVQHAEPQQEQTPPEPTGLPTAQIRQANKSSERRFGRAKPAPVPVTDVPEERLIGLPQPKSTDPKVDPCPVAEIGCAAGTSARTRVSHQKAMERPPGLESCGDLPGESWDLEGSAAIVKKKKKKPKQKRNQPPRMTEFWDENVAASKAPRNSPLATELPKPNGCPLMPAEAHGEQPVASGGRAADTPKDARRVAGSRILEEQNASSVPAQQAQKPSVPLESMSAAKNGGVVKAEEKRDEGLMLQSKSKGKEVPLEQVGKTRMGESVTAKGLTKPTERDFPDKNEKREYKESKRADLAASLSEVIDVSNVETPLQPQPPELLPSDQGKEAQCSSPGRSALIDAVRCELQAARGSLEAAAKQRGRCEKSKEVENGSVGQPLVEDKLPHEPKAAAETKPASSDKCLAIDFSTSEGALKTPTDTTKMPVAPLVSPKPEEVGALQNRKAGVFSEQPFHLSAKSAASERPPAAEAGDGAVVADSPGKNTGKGFVAFEQQPGKDLGITHGLDRPKKKRGEGKAKKIKSFSEQMMPSEDVGKLGDGVRTDETVKETTHPEPGRGFAARGHPSGSITQAYPADKPKKRGSDGRSKKGDRSFFQQPFLESKRDPNSFPDITDRSEAVSDRGRERGCLTAECFQENKSGVTKMQRPIELVTGEPKENLGKSEIGDLGALGESRREEAKHFAGADTVRKTEEASLMKKGREAGVTPAGEWVGVNPGAALVADKPRKRCSDGKTKKAEKSPSGQAAVLDAGVPSSDFPGKERVAGSTKEMPFDKGQVSGLEKELLLENPTGLAREVLGKPEIQGGSFSDQPVLSGHKTETSEPEVVSAKETGPVSKGKELETPEPLPEHRLEAALAQSPTGALVVDKPRKKSRDVKSKKAENSLEPGPGSIPAVGEEVGSSQRAQSFDKGKEADGSTSASPVGDPADTPKVQAPGGSLEPEKSQTSSKENCKKPEAHVQQPVLFEHKAGAGPSPDVEIPDKSKAESPGGGGLPFLEHPAAAGHTLATVPEKSKQRGYDGSGKKAKNASEQPVFVEPKPNRSKGQPPMGSELGHGVGDTDLVDENRNIKNFPVGPQMLCNNKGSDFRSFGQTAAAGPGTGSAPSGFPKHTGEGASGEGLPPPEAAAERSSQEPGAAAAKETQVQKSSEQPITPGHKEPAKEVSKKGGKTQEVPSQDGSEAGKPLSLDHAVQQDIKSKDKVHLSPAAKVDDQEIGTTDRKRNADSNSLDLPQKVADSKNKLAPVGAKGREKPEASVSSGEKDTGCVSAELAAVAESKAGAAVSWVAAEALVEKKAEEAELGGGKKSEQSSLGGLATTAAEAEAPGLNLTAAQTTKVSPQANSEGGAEPAEEDAARGGGAHPTGTAALGSEADKPQDTAKEKEAECDQKAVKEVKKVKAAEQIKGYMRPTKARGVPALPARSAAPDREKPRQLKPAGVSRQRQEKGVCV